MSKQTILYLKRAVWDAVEPPVGSARVGGTETQLPDLVRLTQLGRAVQLHHIHGPCKWTVASLGVGNQCPNSVYNM